MFINKTLKQSKLTPRSYVKAAISYHLTPNKGPAEMGSHSFQRTFEWERLYSDNYP